MLADIKLMAIVRDVGEKYILGLAEILIDSGINGLEISLSNPEKGFACLEKLMKVYNGHGIYIGAGTVSKKSEVDKLLEIGVEFILTPGYDDELIGYALEKGLEVLPGVLTPSDVQKAVNRGINLLKLFPADAFPIDYIKGLKGPFPQTDYVAVGGVNKETAANYFKNGFKGIAVGSNLIPKGTTEKDYAKIKSNAKEYVSIVKRC